jgi:hypothetical protein
VKKTNKIYKSEPKEPNYLMGLVISIVGAFVYFLFFKNTSSGFLRGVILIICGVMILFSGLFNKFRRSKNN